MHYSKVLSCGRPWHTSVTAGQWFQSMTERTLKPCESVDRFIPIVNSRKYVKFQSEHLIYNSTFIYICRAVWFMFNIQFVNLDDEWRRTYTSSLETGSAERLVFLVSVVVIIPLNVDNMKKLEINCRLVKANRIRWVTVFWFDGKIHVSKFSYKGEK